MIKLDRLKKSMEDGIERRFQFFGLFKMKK
jgi:hypothetical protein